MPRFLAALLLPLSAALVATPAAAQYAATQDATLRRLRSLSLALTVSAPDLPTDTATAFVQAVREALGRAGLTVTPEPSDHRYRPGLLALCLSRSIL